MDYADEVVVIGSRRAHPWRRGRGGGGKRRRRSQRHFAHPGPESGNQKEINRNRVRSFRNPREIKPQSKESKLLESTLSLVFIVG